MDQSRLLSCSSEGMGRVHCVGNPICLLSPPYSYERARLACRTLFSPSPPLLPLNAEIHVLADVLLSHRRLIVLRPRSSPSSTFSFITLIHVDPAACHLTLLPSLHIPFLPHPSISPLISHNPPLYSPPSPPCHPPPSTAELSHS